MKFCIKCGTQMDDENLYCPQCGAVQPQHTPQPERFTYEDVTPVQQPTPPQPTQPTPPQLTVATVTATNKKLKSNKKLMPFILGGVGIVVIVFLVFFFRCLVGSGSLTVEGAVMAYYEALSKGDAKDYIDATLSSDMRKAVLEVEDLDDVSELEEEIEDAFEYRNERYRKIKITDIDEVDEDELEDFIDEIEDETDVKVHISKMYEVEVEFEVKDLRYDDDAEWEDDSDILLLYKSNGNWYVEDF